MAKKPSEELKEKIADYLLETWDELTADIKSLPSKERAMARLKLIDYTVPKVQATREDSSSKGSTASELLARESNL